MYPKHLGTLGVTLSKQTPSGASPRKWRTWIAAAILAVALAGLLVCGNEPQTGVPGHGDGDTLFPKLPKVTGHIDQVDANPDNPRYFQTLAITDADGQRWRFHSEGWVGVSVGHLKDHQIQGTPITVWYEQQTSGAPLARFVGD